MPFKAVRMEPGLPSTFRAAARVRRMYELNFCWNPNCSAMKKGHLPVPGVTHGPALGDARKTLYNFPAILNRFSRNVAQFDGLNVQDGCDFVCQLF